MRGVPLFFILLLFIGCVNTIEYRKVYKIQYGRNVVFQSDSTFEVNWRQGLLSGSCQGEYSIDKKIIVLDSRKETINEISKHSTMIDSNLQKNVLKIHDVNGVPISYSKIFTLSKDGQEKISYTDKEGIVESDTAFNQFRVTSMRPSLKSYEFIVEDTKPKFIYVTLGNKDNCIASDSIIYLNKNKLR